MARPALSPMVVTCSRCNEPFRRHNGHVTQKFCSHACRFPKPARRRCMHCTEWFRPRRANPNQECCSRECSRRRWSQQRKLTNRNSGIWCNEREAKAELLKQQKGACKSCGWNRTPEVLELHHKDRNRKNKRLSNLELICPNCHAEDHFRDKTGQFKNNYGRRSVERYRVNP